MNNVKCFALMLVLLGGIIGLSAQTPEWQWAVSAGGTSADYGYDVAMDSQGNQYVTGEFNGTATFGSYTLTSSGAYGNGIFVAKLDGSGHWQWAVSAGGSSFEYGKDIAVDGYGNAYLTGYFWGTATFGPHTLTSSGPGDIYTAKLDPAGNFLWAVKAGGTGIDEGSGIAVDGDGNAWLTGWFQNTASFGDYTLTSSGSDDIFAAKLDPNGNWLWAVKAGGTNGARGTGIAVDGDGNAFLTGAFWSTASFGTHTLTSSGGSDIFAAKLGTNGNWLWAVKAGGGGSDFGWGIAVDGYGNAILSGHFSSMATFGYITLYSSGNQEIFAAKLDGPGFWDWAVSAGGTMVDLGKDIAVDGSGNAYLTGEFEGTASFGNNTLTSSGGWDIFAAKLDPYGNWLWTVKAGGTYNDYGYSIAVNGSGNACLTGCFDSTASFGTHTLTSNGSRDIFVAKHGFWSPIDDAQNPPVTSLTLFAYPNPLRKGETATIKANLAECGSGTLSIFNLRGQCVAVHQLSPGEQQITLDSRELPAGIYLYKLKTRDAWISKKLVLLK